MTAPARAGVASARTHGASARTRGQARTSGDGGARRDPGRSRSTAAERAYARRANRKQRLLRVAPTRTSRLAPKAPFVLLVMGLLVIGVLATLFLSLSAIADSYRLEDAKGQVTELSSKVERLKADVAKMESPDALMSKAKELGMVPAPDPARLRQNPDGSVTVIGTPSAAPAGAPGEGH
ncbi:MAG: hypothetical protein JOZ47_03920 [Kutzneria sp.]|nr:hypothetical protein [Kutzneria sp.]